MRLCHYSLFTFHCSLDRWIVRFRRPILVRGFYRTQTRIEVEMSATGCSYSVGLLRIGSDRVRSRRARGALIYSDSEPIAINHRLLQVKSFVKSGFCDEVGKRTEFSMISPGILRLVFADIVH